MPATTSLRDCSALVTATQEAGGKVPKVLTNILAGAALLNTHSTVSDPARAIVAASTDGTLTAEKLGELVTEAARAQVVNTYIGELRQRSERMFTEEFHRALREGACDELLNSLRPAWDGHAAAIAEARSEINSESTAEHILASGSPRLVECWQQLPEHLDALNQIAAVARQFGPRLGNFPMIREYANSDGFRLEDSAIWCACGGLEAESAAFRRPGTHRSSPLFNVTLRLNTLEQAAERYRQWASAQWESQQAGSAGPGGYIDEHGDYHEFDRPTNPFAEATQ
jgi:hypothetical protein